VRTAGRPRPRCGSGSQTFSFFHAEAEAPAVPRSGIADGTIRSDNHLLARHVITTETPTERRAHRRFIASELRGLRTARVKYGQDVSVIDLSSGGVLFEITGELKPESTIVLEFAAANRTYLVPSRVLRCHDIGTFDNNRRLEGACAFRRPLPIDDLVGDTLPATRASTTARDASVWSGWQLVIGKYRDGRTVRGYTNDFSPTKPYLHVSPTPFADETKFISLMHLDALFFLADANTADANERESAERGSSATRGRRVAMTLPNGKEIIGTTLTYRLDGGGFFVRPLDSDSGATRVFITQSGTKNIRFL
jgi:hypothetical protein